MISRPLQVLLLLQLLLPSLRIEVVAVATAGGDSDKGIFRPVMNVPGRAKSKHYAAEAAPATATGDGLQAAGAFVPVFVYETKSRNSSESGGDGYFSHLNDWTASWISVESDGPILVRVRRLDAQPMTRCRAHPDSAGARVVSVADSVATVTIPGPARLTLDFDGGLDEVDTGPSYKEGPPMHTFSLFVNPPLETPSPDTPGVLTVKPGDHIPTESDMPANTTTIVFQAGVHMIPRNKTNGWRVYTLVSGVRYFLSADAVLHSALNSGNWGADNITLVGYGLLSGEDLDRDPCKPGLDCTGEALVAATASTTSATEITATTTTTTTTTTTAVNDHVTAAAVDGGVNNSPQGLTIHGANFAHIEGITFVDFPNHHLILDATQTYDSAGNCTRNVLANIKVLGWRANGDGVHVFGIWNVQNLFMRTQDDTLYLHAGDYPSSGCPPTVYSGITAWNDANGASFITCGMGTTLRDSDAIYARASWAWWSGGRVFTHRSDFKGSCEKVTIENVRASDPLPSLNAFQLQESGPMSGATYSHVSFRNVQVRNTSVMPSCQSGNGCNCIPKCKTNTALPYGVPNIIAGTSASVNITNLSFQNVTIRGTNIGKWIVGQGVYAGAFNVSRAFVYNISVDGVPI